MRTDGSSMLPPGAAGRRPSVASGSADNSTATSKRSVNVGDPTPQGIPMPPVGDASASPDASAVATAVTASRENLATAADGSTSPASLTLDEGFFYDKSVFKPRDISAKQMDPTSLSLFYSFGFESYRRYNLHFVNEYTVATVVGNVIVFINLRTLDQDYMPGLRDGAIGSIAVHPQQKYIAVAEIYDQSPNIYVFEYPSLKLYRVLRGGAVRGFSNICFDNHGDRLASVGIDPDYMLTIWDWKQEKVVLRSKAFSQDVYSVSFSPESDDRLTTSGMGHIKFWRMSKTFTGLKLQGYLGKFGLTELTDIATFIQLPDGKVLSSTETGNLLLWDGGMIKCEIASKGKKPCHQGRVESIMLMDGEIFTAGEDGYVRIWDFETIDGADVITGSTPAVGAQEASAATGGANKARVFEMEFIDEILVGKDVKIKSMLKCPGATAEFLIQDQMGQLLRLDTQKRTADKIMSFHAGSVASVEASPLSHSLASLGADGTLRLYEYMTKTTAASVRFSSGGTAMRYLPESLDATGCTIAAGFADGVLRILSHTPLNATEDNAMLQLKFVFKPHKKPITSIEISADGTYLATTSSDNTIFFFKINATMSSPDDEEEQRHIVFSRETVQIVPIGYLPLTGKPKKISFSPDNHVNVDEIEPITDDLDAGAGGAQENDNGEEPIQGKRALLVLETGELLSLVVPRPEDVETTLSYELSSEQFSISRWNFQIPAPPPATATPAPTTPAGVASEDGATASSDEIEDSEAQATNKRQTSATRKAHGLVIESESPITSVLYLEGGYFLVSLQNKDGESEIRACKFGTPWQSRLVLVYPNNFTDVRLSTSGKYLLAGAVDGMTCLRKFRLEDILLFRWSGGHEVYSQYSRAFEEEEAKAAARRGANRESFIEEAESTENLARAVDVPGQYWFGHTHSSTHGSVTSVTATFDDSFFATAGADGGMFIWRVALEDIKPSEAVEASDYEFEDDRVTTDIVELEAYSLQEEKIKSEKDKEIADAEVKKQNTRDYVQELRNEFLKVVTENEAALPETQMPRDALNVDPDLRNDIAKQTQEKIHLVQKELEWISEKESIIPNKLRKRFLDDLQTERIELHGFKTSHIVSTFRTAKLERTLDIALQPLLAGENRALKPNQQSSDGDDDVPVDLTTAESPAVKKSQKPGDAKSKLEARKQLRAERAQQWKELMDSKPDESYEDPRDVAAIRFAEQNMGDYKLKTGEKYIVPESERVDADKKRRQIILLKESMSTLKEQYNHKVFQLRDQKQSILQLVTENNKSLFHINKELQLLGAETDDKLWTPTMEASAFPERRFNVTPDDIAHKQGQDAMAAAEAHGDNSDLGFSSAPVASKDAPSTLKSRPGTVAPQHAFASRRSGSALGMLQSSGQWSRGGSSVPLFDGTPETSPAPPAVEPSALENAENELRRRQLQYKKQVILESLDQVVREFDVGLSILLREKVILEADLKFADMKLILLYKEWALLKEFEKYDNSLTEKLVQKQAEKDDIDCKIKECQEKLNGKKAEIEQVIKKEKDIQEEFHRALGENNKYEEQLTKMFRKKIKRTKKKAKPERAANKGEDMSPEEEDEDEELDEEDEDDLYDFSDAESSISDDDDEAITEECPPDYDRAGFAKILQLREDRLDQEDALAEIQKAVEVLKKENDALIKKERVIDQSLKNTENEIQEFQTQKQRKLNELDVVVPLRLHQIQYLEKGLLPADLSQALVFVGEGLTKLKNRIRELQQEKADIRKQHKELKRMHVSLIKNRREKQSKLQELEARATDVQMLKFGQIIDLEKLERMGVNKNADELREKLAKEDSKRLKELEQLDSKINELKEALTEATRENTEHLESLTSLTDTRQRLEEEQRLRERAMSAEVAAPQRRPDPQEREKLIALIQDQGQEIEDLKAELEMLMRKPLRQVPAVLQSRLNRPAADMDGHAVPQGGMVTSAEMKVSQQSVEISVTDQ